MPIPSTRMAKLTKRPSYGPGPQDRQQHPQERRPRTRHLHLRSPIRLQGMFPLSETSGEGWSNEQGTDTPQLGMALPRSLGQYRRRHSHRSGPPTLTLRIPGAKRLLPMTMRRMTMTMRRKTRKKTRKKTSAPQEIRLGRGRANVPTPCWIPRPSRSKTWPSALSLRRHLSKILGTP